MARNLSRDAKLYAIIAGTAIGSATGGPAAPNCWEIKVLDGFSFSQDTGTQDITINEAGATPTRGMKQYNTSLNPVDVSFSTYVRPFVAVDDGVPTNSRAKCIEEILWNSMISNTLGVVGSSGSNVSNSGIVATGTTSCKFDFSNSDLHQLLELDLYFKFDNNTYKITNFTVISAEVDFSIDGIGTINWSGQGTTLAEDSAAHTAIGSWTGTEAGSPDYYSAPDVAQFMKNKFTTMILIDNNVGSATNSDYFTVPITGGTITIDNGTTYLTPEELGVVNTSIGSFTGTRSISGSVTAYLNTVGSEDGTTEALGWPTAKLIEAMQALTDATNTNWSITLRMGGTSTDNPRVDFYLGSAQLTFPSVNIEDVIATEINFIGQGSTGLEATNELTIDYVPSTDTTYYYDDTNV